MEEWLSLKRIIEVMESKGYKVWKNPKGHDLNIVGIRTKDMTANCFNDWITLFYVFEDIWSFVVFPATTDPGTFYRKNPGNVNGTAILKLGQYRGAFKVGSHRGKYTALVQQKPVTVYRDANRDEVLDVAGMAEETGLFGINIHRANPARASARVDTWSAGCQVMRDPDHFAFFMMLCERGKEKFGNSFTYTLLQEDDFSS